MPRKKTKKTPSKEEARNIFHRAFGDGSVRYTNHSRDRMGERGIDANDLMELSVVGLIYNEPEPDKNTGEMKFLIECQKMNLKVVFTIHNKKTIRLITVMNCK